MKKISILFLFVMTHAFYAQTAQETLDKANALLDDKKYESAYVLLDRFDPANQQAAIVIRKSEIVLNYFVSSIMHQLFALKDIDSSESILAYRGQEGSYTMYNFDADAILNHLLEKEPTNCLLHKALGNYYYEIHVKYGDNWLKNREEQFKKMQTHFQHAIDGKCADYISNYVLGYIQLVQENPQASIPYFHQSIQQNPQHAPAQYNLAYAYLFMDNTQQALNYAKQAFEMYSESSYKSDAARMIGQIYVELEDDKNAIAYFQQADEVDPDNYYTLKSLLSLYLKSKDERIRSTTQTFFNLAPDNPTIYNDLHQLYGDFDQEKELATFYQSQFKTFTNEPTVEGNLHFYIARAAITLNKNLAKSHFTKAKATFEKIFSADHPVFSAIEDGIAQCEK